MSKPNEQNKDTISALLQEKPKRGRPRHAVSRQNVYVELSPKQKKVIGELASKQLPKTLKRADIPDLAIIILNARMEALRRAVSSREREMPEGITDLESLYLLWDLPLPETETKQSKWTSIRVSPQQVIELSRIQGMFKGAFGSTRSQTFSLALTILVNYLEGTDLRETAVSFNTLKQQIKSIYL